MNFLKGPKQIVIPIYQRTYSWTLKECGQFPISLLLATFSRVLFVADAYREAEWKN
jgi:hypothetical protein